MRAFAPTCAAVAILLAAALATGPATAGCVLDPTPCRGCGCKGGPGWREIAGGRCVGFRDIDRRCGRPPSSARCVFENAPGTGANRACALEGRPPPKRLPGFAP